MERVHMQVEVVKRNCLLDINNCHRVRAGLEEQLKDVDDRIQRLIGAIRGLEKCQAIITGIRENEGVSPDDKMSVS